MRHFLVRDVAEAETPTVPFLGRKVAEMIVSVGDQEYDRNRIALGRSGTQGTVDQRATTNGNARGMRCGSDRRPPVVEVAVSR